MAMLNRFKPASHFVLPIVQRRYFCGVSLLFYVLVFKIFVLYVFIFLLILGK